MTYGTGDHSYQVTGYSAGTEKFSPKTIPADHEAMGNIFTAEVFRRRHDSDEKINTKKNQINYYLRVTNSTAQSLSNNQF